MFNILQKKKKMKIGLALGSGGANGLAHIGVLKVLEEKGIKIDYIAGSSIGALIGAYYAAHKNVKRLEEIALGTNWLTGASLFDPGFKGGIIKGGKLEMLLKEWFHEVGFEDLLIPMCILATDLESGKEVVIKDGSLIKALRASVSVPLVFEPVRYNGTYLGDAGLSNPLPDDTVRNMGADFVIAVNLETSYLDDKLTKASLNIPNLGMRALNIMRYQLASHSTRTADIIIGPKLKEKGLIGWRNFFDQKRATEVIRSGEKAAKEALNSMRI